MSTGQKQIHRIYKDGGYLTVNILLCLFKLVVRPSTLCTIFVNYKHKVETLFSRFCESK